MKLAFIADEITEFTRDHDSTWVLMQAAHELDHQVFYALAGDLREDQSAEFIELKQSFFEEQEINNSETLCFKEEPQKQLLKLDHFDYILMRKDPPVDKEYIQECHILSQCKEAKVINNPQALIELNEKLMILNFPELIIDTIVTDNEKQIGEFLEKHKSIILKPLDGYGGSGIELLQAGEKAKIKTILEKEKTIMAQKYIPEIKTQGDKRIIICNGEPIGALLRTTPDGGFKANLAAGGSYQKTAINDRDLEICSTIKDFLLDNGIYFAGIDIIGDYLTEINITSPTCLQEINRVDNLKDDSKMERIILDRILK